MHDGDQHQLLLLKLLLERQARGISNEETIDTKVSLGKTCRPLENALALLSRTAWSNELAKLMLTGYSNCVST